MATVEVTQDNLTSTLEGNDIVILDFWAEWCMPCRNFAPVFEQVSDKHPEITFGKINTEKEQELAGAAGITSIPTVMIFRDSLPVFVQSGALPASALEDLITQVKALDMDEVRRKAAEADATAE